MKTELITVCTILGLNYAGSAEELNEHIFKNLSDLASLKNNFTEQLTDDEDEDSTPFSLESTNDANKQPLTPPIYYLPSPQDVFVPLLQTQRNQSQRGNEENAFLFKDLFSTMRSFTGNDNYSVKAIFRDVEENFIFIPRISDLLKFICVKRLLQGPAKAFIQTLHNILTYSSLKAALIEEFEDLFCSYDVHKEMQKRKLRPTESLFEYFLAMREIASKAHFRLEDQSLIMYCISGIPDSNHKKLTLYAFVNEVVSEVVNEINSSSEIPKTVTINGYDFDALIDTGSTITLIRESVYQILGRLTLNATKIKLTSFSKSEIKLFGSFKSTINIEDNKFMTDFYVINNSQTTFDVIIGTDVLKQTEFKIRANGIELIPKKKDHFINLINVSKTHNQSELKDNALEVLQLNLKNAEDKCKNLEMHVCNTSTLSLEKTVLLDKLHKLEESNLEKVDKLVNMKRKKILVINALTESNDHPKTSMSTKELEIKPSKRKTKKLKSSGRNAKKTSDSDENQALAKEKNDLLRQIDFLNSIILDTKLKEPRA
ncbi:transposon Tf2-9 polyprotein [Trichonephila clavipes]|nr:transposon Tf2-9 polyprotein [Trichonephila clavipes]